MNPPRILDGKALAETVLMECRAEAAALIASGVVPGLAVVLVGDDPASKVYVGWDFTRLRKNSRHPPPAKNCWPS
jgi:5,10-methylene-tetrahydrofolate dehydrogenase/methenyl tetrahydrofolate cyclohydrolase